METTDFIAELEARYKIKDKIIDYLKSDDGWRKYNEKYTSVWVSETEDYRKGDVNEYFAKKYFSKPQLFFNFLKKKFREDGHPIDHIHLAFLPLKNYNAQACLTSNGDKIIVIDIFLEKNLGALNLILLCISSCMTRFGIKFLTGKPLTDNEQKELDYFSDLYFYALRLLVGINRDESKIDLYHLIPWENTEISICKSPLGYVARQYQDSMLFFIILHELSHHLAGDVNQNFSFNSMESDKDPLMEYDQESEFNADSRAIMLWQSIVNRGIKDDEFDNLGSIGFLDFFAECGASPFVLFKYLSHGYQAFKPELFYNSNRSHPTPQDRYDRLWLYYKEIPIFNDDQLFPRIYHTIQKFETFLRR